MFTPGTNGTIQGKTQTWNLEREELDENILLHIITRGGRWGSTRCTCKVPQGPWELQRTSWEPRSGCQKPVSLTYAVLPSLSCLVALAPFLPSSEATFSASPFSTACSSRSSFLFHSLVCGAKRTCRASKREHPWLSCRQDPEPPGSPPSPSLEGEPAPQWATLKIPFPSPWRHPKGLVSQKKTSTVQWNSGRSPNSETKQLLSTEMEKMKQLSKTKRPVYTLAYLRLNLTAGTAEHWPLTWSTAHWTHKGTGPTGHQPEAAWGLRHATPPSAFTVTAPGQFIAVLSCTLVLSSCLGFQLNRISPETKPPPGRAITHQMVLSKVSTTTDHQPLENNSANGSNRKALAAQKLISNLIKR